MPFHQDKTSSRAVAASAVAVVVCCMVANTAAFGAGSGYGVSPPPSAAVGGFHKVVSSKTIPISGGSVKGSSFGTSATVIIPDGSLKHPSQVVLTGGSPNLIRAGHGRRVVAGMSVVLLNPNNGKKLFGPFSPALKVTLRDPSIVKGDYVVEVISVGKSFKVPSTVTKGQAIVFFKIDANFAVVHG